MALVGNSPSSPHEPHLGRVNQLVRPTEVTRAESADRPEILLADDPTLIMQELAEELGFLKAEESAGSDELSEDAEQDFEDLISRLIRESLKAQLSHAPENRNDAQAMRARLVQMQWSGSSGQNLEEILAEFSGGNSQKALAIMAELVSMAKDDPELQKMGIDWQALEKLALSHEAGLVAGLNIAEALQNVPASADLTAQRLLSIYENSIAASGSVLQTFQRLGQSEGISALGQWRGFLTEAVAADLSRQNSSSDKAQLVLILDELKGFRTFNTLIQGVERRSAHLPDSGAPDGWTVLQTTLDYVEQPLREFPRVESWVMGRSTQQQILFFQGFRQLLKAIPDDVYASPEQKAGLLIPPQKKVDDLTFTEDL